MPDIRYQRLTYSRSRSAFSVVFMIRRSLWLGPDHLLCIDTNGYSESYKRFYFRDIQAIIVRETARRKIWNVILLVPSIICLTGMVSSVFSGNIGAVIAWAIASAVFLAPCLVNTLLGRACACQLRTAVQTEDLRPLCRVRQTRKVLAKIRPLIVAAQGGGLTPDAVSARMRDMVAASPAVEPPSPLVSDDPNAPPRIVS